jgi:DNA-binding HxlR family transcriptional regulator
VTDSVAAIRLEVDVRRSSYSPEPDCAIAQSLGVIGDGWELLIVRDAVDWAYRTAKDQP